MRISQNMIYGMAVRQMGSSLTELTRLNMMNASQKRINTPSDDPAGMGLVLDLRSTLAGTERWQRNIDQANGWLALADSELSECSSIISTLLEKAEQGATGTITDDQRLAIAEEVRGFFEQLVGIANTDFTGQSIFAGHKTDGNAYEQCLWATPLDGDLAASDVVAVTGDSESTILVEFGEAGTVGADELSYSFSTDGGKTWKNGVLASNSTTLSLGGARLTLASGAAVTAPAGDDDPGTRLMVRPSARYLGDDDTRIEITSYGTPGIDAAASGTFGGNVQVRIDADTTLAGPMEYSYSVDGGTTWVSGNTASNGVLVLPGGVLALSSNGGNTLDAGDSFTLRPATADIKVSIGKGQQIAINNIGSDIFGGLTRDAVTGLDAPALDSGNLFEAAGELVGYLEIGDEDGVGKCLETLKAAQEDLLARAGEVGARLNRLDFQEASLDAVQASAESHLSKVEDADAGELTVDLARAQYVYEAVLQSQAKVMSLSLLDYL